MELTKKLVDDMKIEIENSKEQKTVTAKPFLRWAGSKRKLIPRLHKYWDNNSSRYLEPFVGSGQLFFSLNCKESILSDINYELILTYKVIKKNPTEINYFLKRMPLNKNFYCNLRSMDIDMLTENERGARFVYLNRYCFNGLYRTNLNGQFNVPFSPKGTGSLPTQKELNLISERLRNTRLVHSDFEKIIVKTVKENDFIYLDPPYAVSNRRLFRQYDPHTFGLEDMERLSSLLFEIDKRGAKFLLSYAFCAEAISYFGDWNYKKVFTQRNISGFASSRKKAAELLFTNIN
jgi:DNA adenine methylase